MISIMRLFVGAGLFAFGYYLGRQSCRFESLQQQSDEFEAPASTPKPEKVNPE